MTESIKAKNLRRPKTASKTTASKAAPKTVSGAARNDILDAALKVFARDSFEGASLLEIAKLAHIGQPLIHYHFGSKEKLWRAAIDYALTDLERFYRELIVTTIDLEPIDNLKVLCRAFIQFAARYPEHAHIFINEMRTPGERFDWIVEKYLRPIHHQMDSIVALAIERGQLKPIPTVFVTNTIFISLVHFFTISPLLKAIYAVDPADPEAIAAHAKYTIEIIFNGIKA